MYIYGDGIYSEIGELLRINTAQDTIEHVDPVFLARAVDIVVRGTRDYFASIPVAPAAGRTTLPLPRAS